MRIKNSKIFKRTDGTRIKITARIEYLSIDMNYEIKVEKCEPKKRKFHEIVDRDNWEYRHQTMEERKETYIKHALELVKEGEIALVLHQLWQNMKPFKFSIRNY